ncbi:MAG: hypothetical protein P8X42_19060, partial [Calditrichaceae bacterium]
ALNDYIPFDHEFKFTTAKDNELWVRIVCKPVEEDHRIVKLIGMFQDISQYKSVELEKERLFLQLNQAQKMESIGRLAGGVAHDFNNMLAVILGHAEIARKSMDKKDPAYIHIVQMENAANRSADLTSRLLAFARKQTIDPKVLDLNETIEKMLKMLQRLIGEDIELIWAPADDICRVKMDPSQLDQLLANLAVNARDAIEGVGNLTIETHNVEIDEEYSREHSDFTKGEYVLLVVSDTGKGMDKFTRQLYPQVYRRDDL